MATPEGRSNYAMIQKEDWEILGYVGPRAHQRPDDLDDEIHDLFQYDLPGRPLQIWHETRREKYSREQYQVFRRIFGPVFRLATKLLLCPASLDWLYYLIFAPRTRTNPLIKHKGDDVYQYRLDDTPTQTRHAMAKAALKRLARVHTIHLRDFGVGDLDEGRTEPTIEVFKDGVNIKDDSGSRISGVAPRFLIDKIFYHQFLASSIALSPDSILAYNLRTKMAVTFIHEFCHGASMASSMKLLRDVQREIQYRNEAYLNNIQRDFRTVNINEDLFEDENLAEPGYSWESFVFGGNIELLELNPANPLIFMKWPNFLKGSQDLRRGGWKSSATQYFVPWAWVVNVNSQNWWNTVRPDDNTALYIKKIIGVRKPCPFPNVDEDWSSGESSEGIWGTDEQRSDGRSQSQRVTRIRPNITIEDPSAARANEWAS